MIEFACAACGKTFRLNPEHAGRKTACSACKQPLVVPGVPTSPPNAPPRIAFSCTQCGMKFRVMAEFAGRATQCPSCKTKLTVPAPDATVAYVPPAGKLEGAVSSLARAEVDPGVTLGGGAVAGQAALADVLVGRKSEGARYVIDKELARGGMGAVLSAVDCDIRREVAIKYLLKQDSAVGKLRFVEEAQIAGQLEHPNIVPIHELGVDAKKRVFFSMKMVKGRSLAQILQAIDDDPVREGAEFSLPRLLTAFDNVCNAIAYAHSRGVVHRDLKPANIMVGDFGETYVMDWGLAKVLRREKGNVQMAAPLAMPVGRIVGEASEGSASSGLGASDSGRTVQVVTSREEDADLTQAGAVLGTPVYMPPEQAKGDLAEVDERSDLYSLGAILYQILTLRPPIDKSGGMMAILLRVAEGEIAKPEEAVKQSHGGAGRYVPSELAAVAMKALAKEKHHRYPRVEDLQADVRRFQEGRSVSAKQDTTWETFKKLMRRNKGASIAVGALAPLLLVVLLFSSISNYLARKETAKAYQDYQDQVKQSVPAFVKAARLAAEQHQFDDAMKQVEIALKSDPKHADGHLLRGQLLVARQDFGEAKTALETYLTLRPKDRKAQELAKLCGEAKRDDIRSLLVVAEVLNEHGAYAMVDSLLRKYGKDSNEARKVVRAMYAERIDKAWPGKGGGLVMDVSGLHLNLSWGSLTDISPLRDIPLTSLNLRLTKVTDLSPLKGMPLRKLTCANSPVTDLSPLRGMALEHLGCPATSVKDLSPLKGMPLRLLHCTGTGVADLTPLQGMPLEELLISGTPISSLEPLRGMPLQVFECSRTGVNDLVPLSGMPLKHLNVSRSLVGSLSALKGMPIANLDCHLTKIGDLEPLRGMPLRHLDCSDSLVNDLSPLADMKLVELRFPGGHEMRGIDAIRRMPTLVELGTHNGGGTTKAPAEFWKTYNAVKGN